MKPRLSVFKPCQRTPPLLIADHTWMTTDVFAGRKQEDESRPLVELGFSLASVRNTVSAHIRLQELFGLHRQTGSGHRRKTTSPSDRLTLRLAKLDPTVSSKMSSISLTQSCCLQLKEVVRREWCYLSEVIVNHVIDSMPSRIAEELAVRVKVTKH